MAFRDIYTGGACNTSDQSNAQNPFTQFLDNVMLGKAQQQQMINPPGVQQDANVEQQLQQRQLEFQMMNQAFVNRLANEFNQMSLIERQRMEQAYQESQMGHEQFLQFQQHMMQQQWQESELQHEADQLAQEFKFNEAFDNAEQEVTVETQKRVVKEAASDMMQMMANDPDPKFQNSKFLSFLKKINDGNLTIVNKQLLDKDGASVEVPALEADLENAWKTAVQQQHEESKQQQQLPAYEEVWQQHLQDYEKLRSNDQTFEKMLEDQYKKILSEMEVGGDVDDMMSKAWQGASDLQEQQLYKESNDSYQFQDANPYMVAENPLEIAMKLAEQGQTSNSILAFEAHLQRNLGDCQAWRIMGRLHQENDQDQKAVSCFLNALQSDPNNLDTLLALGISCTNILDEVQAMNYLKKWLMRNPKYQSLNFDPQIVPDEQSIYDFTMDQIKEMNHQMLHIYQEAMLINPNDPDLMNCLAVLFFINRNYEKSVELFKKALQIEPKSYSLWNKLGATLAHLNEPEQAVFCYHRALDLRPNFVRVWVNLGIASSHKSDYHEAARLYLSALTLNPQAQHIWGYLQTSFMCMKRADLIQKISAYDPKVFLDEFEITNFQDLPQPEIDYGQANQDYIFKMDTANWVNEFQQFNKDQAQ